MLKRLLCTTLALLVLMMAMPAFAAISIPDSDLDEYTDVMDMTGYFSTSPMFGDENLQHEWIEENLKINIIGSFATGDSPANKLAQMVASGEMPDVVYASSSYRNVFQEMVDAGMVAAADDYFDVMPNYLKYREGAINDYWADPNDGKHYMLPGFVCPPEYLDELGIGDPAMLVIRSDVLEATGLPIPETIDEFYNFLVKSKEVFEGVGGLYENFTPFVISHAQTWNAGYAQLLNHSFYLNGGDVEIDDENGWLVESFMTDAWADGTRFLAKLYREGLIDSEIITADGNMLLEKAKLGNYGVMWCPISWHGEDVVGSMYRLGYDVEWITMKLPGVNGTEGTEWCYKNSLGSSIGVVSAKAADKERIFKYIDWQNTDIGNCITWWGGPGDGESYFSINENYEVVRNYDVDDLLTTGEISTDYISAWTYWIAGLGVTSNSDINLIGINAEGLPEITAATRANGIAECANDPKLDAYFLSQKGEVYEACWTDITTIVDEYRAAIIMRTANDEEVDALLAEMYEELEAAGIYDVMAENYELYNS